MLAVRSLPVSHSCAALPTPMMLPKVLLVDDDECYREAIGSLLRSRGFAVVEAVNVVGALKLISAQSFDALLSDLHMPAASDGLTVVSAMRHLQPNAVTLLMSASPEMTQAAEAILKQPDELLLKPLNIDSLIGKITGRLRLGAAPQLATWSVASVLEREAHATIEDWLRSVSVDPLVGRVPMETSTRCAHLPRLFEDLVFRLCNPLPLGRCVFISAAAAEHGLLRRGQGYSAAMMVEEARMLQVSIFHMLEQHRDRIDSSQLLSGVMAIADEVDSQLTQHMASFQV